MKTEFDQSPQTALLERPKTTTPRPQAHAVWDDEEPEVSGFKKYRMPVIAGVVLACGIGFVANALSKKSASPPPKQETTTVHLIAPPPPPPPPAPPPPPQAEEKKQEMIEEVKQEEAPPEPAPQVQTALVGKGDGGMQLAKGNGSGSVFGNRSSVSAERLRWSAYAGQVKSRIVQALESSSKTRRARMQIVVHVWLDDTGRITRATLDGTSSDSAVDAAIRDEVLPGLQVSSPPPQGMPMPINMRITAQRRN